MAINETYPNDTVAPRDKNASADEPTANFDPDMPHDACDQDDEDEAGNP